MRPGEDFNDLKREVLPMKHKEEERAPHEDGAENFAHHSTSSGGSILSQQVGQMPLMSISRSLAVR